MGNREKSLDLYESTVELVISYVDAVITVDNTSPSFAL